MIVLKFGGTSVGDAPAMLRTATIISERIERNPVVVISAMAQVTDQLMEAAGLATERRVDAARIRSGDLAARHFSVLEEVTAAGPGRDEAARRLHVFVTSLRGALDALSAGAVTPEQGTDLVAAHGELLSTTLLTAALRDRGVDAVWVDAREFMITDDAHGRARPCLPELAARGSRLLLPLIEAGRIPVTQGFIGETPEGITTTIGRGGSDFTATLLGGALGAEEIQIWTDVHGLMTADPRVVPGARPLAQVTYDEAAELAYFGAKVLHPAAIVPALEGGIDLRIRNSLAPEHPGTRISSEPGTNPGTVKSIASKRGISTLSVRSPRMLGAHGYLRELFGIFDRHEVVVDVVATSEVSVSLSLESGPVPEAVIRDVSKLGEVQVQEGRSIICVVGEAMRETPGIAARIFRAISTLNVEMVSQGASRINVTLVVKDEDAAEVVRLLHAEFFPD